MSYDYSDSYVTDRASHGGKDANRKATMDQWFAAAQHGDPQAIQELENMAGMSGTGQGWATADARNYDKMLLGRLGIGGQPQYDQAHDGSFNPVHALGSAMKFAAPFAGLIPGVGLPLGAALGAGGSALGGALHGDKFNLGKTLLAGAAGGAGSYLMGGEGFHGIGGAPGRLGSLFGIGGHNAATAGIAGTGTQSMPGVAGAAATGGGGAGAGGALGTLDRIGSLAGKYGPMVMGGLGVIGAGKAQSHANALTDQAVQGSMQDWQSRAPVRARAQQLMLGPMPQAPNLNSSLADYGNPFYHPLPVSR